MLVFLDRFFVWNSVQWVEGTAEPPQVAVAEPAEELPAEGPGALEETTEDGEEAAEEEQTQDSEISLLFAGDLFLTDVLQTKYRQQGIGAAASDELLQTTRNADIFMLNEEFPFGTTGEAMEDKEYTFRVDPGFVSVLPELGVDIVTLANNHMLDFGRGPLTETLEVLDQNDQVITGLYSAGTDSCTVYGDSYMFLLPGNTMGYSVNTGKFVGEAVSELLKK